jgi:hypothetical protein
MQTLLQGLSGPVNAGPPQSNRQALYRFIYVSHCTGKYSLDGYNPVDGVQVPSVSSLWVSPEGGTFRSYWILFI